MSVAWSIIEAIVDLVAPQLLDRRRVRFAVHLGNFHRNQVPYGPNGMPMITHQVETDSAEKVFFEITNLSRDRSIEVTHVWLDTSLKLSAMQPQRPLPKRLEPDENWGTWLSTDNLPSALRKDVHKVARARLSTGRVIAAIENKDLPESGHMPGYDYGKNPPPGWKKIT